MGEMGRQFDGSYAEYTILPKEIVVPFESDLEWSTLGAIPEMFHTVSGSLYAALKIKQDETILIRGGTSSIGMLAIQMAKTSGLKVIATTRQKEKIESLLNNGADHVLIDDGDLSTKVRQVFPEGVDKVLELVGTSTLRDSLLCVAQGGSVCFTGMLSEQWWITNFVPMDYIPATVNLTVFDSGQVKMDKDRLQAFINDVEAGNIKLNISGIFKMDDIVEAHRYMESNSGSGKIVVVA
jgi:NADPH:quinone reductase-like Zn-dependent oxidoreductase